MSDHLKHLPQAILKDLVNDGYLPDTEQCKHVPSPLPGRGSMTPWSRTQVMCSPCPRGLISVTEREGFFQLTTTRFPFGAPNPFVSFA
jgi:hypothetical protein